MKINLCANLNDFYSAIKCCKKGPYYILLHLEKNSKVSLSLSLSLSFLPSFLPSSLSLPSFSSLFPSFLLSSSFHLSFFPLSLLLRPLFYIFLSLFHLSFIFYSPSILSYFAIFSFLFELLPFNHDTFSVTLPPPPSPSPLFFCPFFLLSTKVLNGLHPKYRVCLVCLSMGLNGKCQISVNSFMNLRDTLI